MSGVNKNVVSARRVGDLDQPVQSKMAENIAGRLVLSFLFQWTLKMHEINLLIFGHLDRIIFIVNNT